jgi:HAD superfamily hydrolase (TIGR01549 family)
MPFKLVVFDFDGTVADSLMTALGIFNRFAAELRYKPIEDTEAVRSMTTRQFMKHHGISLWRLPRLVRKFHAAAAEEAEKLKLYPGLPEMLATLHTDGVRLGILSSNKEENIRRCLRVNGAEEFFAFVVGYPKLFGKGRALRRIVRAERIERPDVLYVGDEMRDIEAARKAGVASAAVTWGFHAEPLLRTSEPNYIVNDPAKLPEVVRTGNPAARPGSAA